MITVEKELKIILEGEDAKTLIDVCELARRMCGHGGVQAEYRDELFRIKRFLDTIFDST